MSDHLPTLHIFVVEDNAVLRQSLIQHLEDMLPTVVVAWAGTEQASVAWLDANPQAWDIAILDLFLIQGSGLGVAFSLVKRASSQKVVVLSNYATPDIRQRCLNLKVDAVFDKSVELDAFSSYLRKICSSREV